MDLLLKVLQIVVPVACLLGGVFVPAWIKSVIRSELKDLNGGLQAANKDIDDHEGRLQAVEQWRFIVAADVHAIPANNAILTRLESTMDRTNGTLDRLNTTITNLGERVAKVEGRNGS